MKELVVKDNALINASYSLDLVEQRLILLAIIEARESNTPSHLDLTVHAETYAKQFDVHKNTAYQALQDACKNLFERRFSYKKRTPRGNIEHVMSRWVQKISYIENEALVRLRFSDDVLPLITKLEEQFTSYELEQVCNLSSVYAVRLYEILISWRSLLKTPIIDLEILRDQLGVSESDYPRMYDFKNRVLDIAILQINTHTDITASYEQHKSGRVITGFSFSFKTKNIKPVDKQPKHLQERRTARQTKPMPEVADPWDKLHQAELKACQKINPALCRADVQRMAQEQGVSALEVMHGLKNK